MPQTLVQKNGRWQLVGDDHSHDHTPPPPTPGAKPKAKPQKPKAKAPQKPWWHAITNELRYAGKQLRSLEATQKPGTVRSQNPALSALTLLALGPTGMLVNEAARRSPVVRQLQAAIGFGALQTAGEGVISLGQKILAPGKYADARRSPPGRALNAYVRAGYQALGAKQPEDLTEGQRGVVDNTGRMIGVEVATSLVGGPIGKGLTVGVKGASWASRGVRWGTALGVTHGLSSFLQDSTQGNPSNMLEAATGIKGIPFAVDPTKDDRVTSGFKSIFPNIAVGELIGLAGSAGARAAGVGAKAAGKQFENIRRWRRAAGANTTHVTAGEKLQARGLVEDIEEQQRFTEQALEKPAPVPIPQTPDEARDAVLARWGRGAQQPADQVRGATEMVTTPVEAPVPAAAPAAAEQSSATPAATAETAPLPDPWFYDPALPEVADAQKLVSQLDPAELRAVAAVGADGGPVLQHIEEVIASRPAPQPREEISEAWAGIPTDKISEIYLNGAGDLQPWSAQLDRLPATTLEELSHPDASPALAQRIGDDTGKTWPFSREEVINGMQALSADGTTIVPNRLRGDIRTMRTEDIYAAPQEFQYKEGINAQGEQLGQSLGGVERWDPNAEGVLQVFTDPRDGKTKVVNGHNRRALADRLGVPTLRVEEVNATTPAAARAAGAISNISAGNGTPFDAAKFIRSTGLTDQAQLQAAGIPLDKGWGRQGLALSRLPDDIFQQAVNGEQRLGRFVALGESGLDEPGMRGAYQVLKQRPKMTEDTFREVLDQAKQQGNVVASSAQGGLFGDEVLNPMLQRAELVADVRLGLAKDRRLFGFATRNADALSEAGATTIDTAAAGQRVADAQQALGLFDTLKNQSGPVGELLSQGAERIAQGENASIVAKQIQREIGDSIERELASSGMKATPQELAPPPPAPPPIPEPDRATLEAHAIQRAIANGEVRPTEMGPLDLPPAPSADIRAVQRELAAMDPTLPLEDQLPNMPATRQAAADELRLAAEYARQDAEIAWAAEKAAREAEGYDLLSLQEKKAQGLGQEWTTPNGRKLSLETKDKLRVILTNTIREVAGDDVVIRFNDTYPVGPAPKEWGGMPGEAWAVKGSYTPHQPPDFEQDYITINGLDSPATLIDGTETAYHEAWHRIQYLALGESEAKILDSTWARLKIAIGSGHLLDSAKISYGESQAVAVQRYAAARRGGTDPTQYLLAEYPPDGKIGKLALKFFSGVDRVLDFGEKVWNALSGNGFMSTRSIFEDFRQGNLIERYDFSAAPLRTYHQDGWFEQTWSRDAVPTSDGLGALSSIFREVSGAPEFTLPPELTKNPPTYGRNALQFESDLDRAAYVLATKPVDGRRKAANKLRNALAAAGFDPDQVAAHGKAVQQAVESVSRDTSGGQVVVPVQDFAAGSPRLPLPEQQRQIDGTRAQIDDLQQKLNEGGCGT